ncbi:MAG: SH3 domain-containing protein [Bdellovibrio sp.]
MFGLCVLNKGLLAFLVLLFPLFVRAESQQGTVIEDGAMVYQDADFDSPIIATLKLGSVYSISKGVKGAFYKIRIKEGTVGWISDVDIKPGVVKAPASKKNKKAAEKEKEEKEKELPKKPFFAARYRGPSFDFINFTEDTLGKQRSEYLLFYGLKFNGFNTLFEGEIYSEGNILFHVGAPKYYSETTKKNADGFIFLADFLLQTASSQGKNRLFFYGFGPVLKYSHFDLELPNGTTTSHYSADDMNLGAVFNVGYAWRLWKTSLRTDAKWYWEKAQYPGFGVNLGIEY